MRRFVKPLAVAGLTLATSLSCAHYEYDILQPTTMPVTHVGTSEDVIYGDGPVRYHFRTEDDRLVVRVFNSSPLPLEVVGVKSTVIDPSGQARPLRSVVLPPGAFTKIVLPPIRPEFVDPYGRHRIYDGPGYGPGYGGGAGPGYGRREFNTGGYFDDEPRYYVLADGGETYWEWQGETSARLIMHFKQAEKEFEQSFVFGRRRMQ
jgi:hypothetical protein